MKTPNLADEEDIIEQPILELSATTQLSDYVSAIAWSPSGNTLAAACCNDIHIWNSHNWDARLYQWELNSPASTLAWSPDGAYLACAIHDHSIGGLDWSKVKYLQEEPVDEDDLPTRMSGFPGKIRHLAWADLPPTANFPPFLAASTRELVTVWVKSPLDWESWVLELSSGNVIDLLKRCSICLVISPAQMGNPCSRTFRCGISAQKWGVGIPSRRWLDRALASGCGGSAGTRRGGRGILLSSLASHGLSVSSRGAAG